MVGNNSNAKKAGSWKAAAGRQAGFSSLPEPWLYSIASWLLQHGRLALFRTCTAHAGLVLSHPGTTSGLCTAQTHEWADDGRTWVPQPSDDLLARAVAMMEKHSSGSTALTSVRKATLDEDQGEYMACMTGATASSVLSKACSLVGPDCQQLAALTTLRVGGGQRSNHWSFDVSLIVPEFLVRLCPNLQTLHLQHVSIGSLPEPATDDSALEVFSKLESLHLECIELSTPGSEKAIAQQASRFPALTSLTISFQYGNQAHALSGLVGNLAPQLTHMTLVSLEPDFGGTFCSQLLPAETLFPKLQNVCWAAPDKWGTTYSVDSLHLVLPALQRLYLQELHTAHLVALLNAGWLHQLKHLSCSRLVIKVPEPVGDVSVASIMAALQACGGVHIKHGPAKRPVLELQQRCDLNHLALPHIHFPPDKLLLYTPNLQLNRAEVAALGQRCQSSYVHFRDNLEAAIVEDLPQLMPHVSRFCFGCRPDDVDEASVFEMCRRVTRPLDVCVYDDDPEYGPGNVLDFDKKLRAACPASKARVCWDNGQAVTPAAEVKIPQWFGDW